MNEIPPGRFDRPLRGPGTTMLYTTTVMNYVIIGGTMESKHALDYVASVLHSLEPSARISTYTYAFAMKHKSLINKALKDAFLITHSSGAMVIGRGAKPSQAVFISPIYPSPRIVVMARAALKTFVHSWRILYNARRRHVARYLLSNVTELFTHPYANLRPFFTGEFSRFDLRTILQRHPLADRARILVSTNDEMFTTKPNMYSELEEHGVEIVHIDAMHDELFIDTENILKIALKH